jgi:flagellar motor switch protein FliN/FliY
LASDISNIIKSEIVSTLESLLSVTASVNEVVPLDGQNFGKCAKIGVNFEFSGNSSSCNIYIPAQTGTKFEYLMLGGATDLKEELDDEIIDAVKEIASTISGSVATSVNAQGFDDITGLKFTLGDSAIIECSEKTAGEEQYDFKMKLNDEDLSLVIGFDDKMLPFIGSITGKSSDTQDDSSSTPAAPASIISTLLGDESADNLRLLFNIKMRLSVRLGSKICLLKDVISWDIGEIIELTQMISEPLDILVNGVVIGTGDPIIVEGKFGVKIKSIGIPKDE